MSYQTERSATLQLSVQPRANVHLDGELVVTQGGKPDLALVAARCQLRAEHKIRTHARTGPATYIVFDQLFDGYRSLMDQPLVRRRETLAKTDKAPSASQEQESLVTTNG